MPLVAEAEQDTCTLDRSNLLSRPVFRGVGGELTADLLAGDVHEIREMLGTASRNRGGRSLQPTTRPFSSAAQVLQLAAGMLTTVDSDLDFENGEWRSYPENIGPGRHPGHFDGAKRRDGPPVSFALAPLL